MMTLTDIQLAEAAAIEPLMEAIFAGQNDKRDCAADKPEFAEINESFAAQFTPDSAQGSCANIDGNERVGQSDSLPATASASGVTPIFDCAQDRREDGMAEAREVIQEQKVRATKEELIGELGNADCDFLRASITEDWRKASAAIMRMHDTIYKLVALEP